MDTLTTDAQQRLVTVVCAQRFQSRMLTRAPVDIRLCISGYPTHILFAMGGQFVWAQPWSIIERAVMRRFVEDGWNMMIVQRLRNENDRFLEPTFMHVSERVVNWSWIRIDCIRWENDSAVRSYPQVMCHYQNRRQLGLDVLAHHAGSFLLHNQVACDSAKAGIPWYWAEPSLKKADCFVLQPGSKRGHETATVTADGSHPAPRRLTYAQKIQEAIEKSQAYSQNQVGDPTSSELGACEHSGDARTAEGRTDASGIPAYGSDSCGYVGDSRSFNWSSVSSAEYRRA